MDDIGIQRHPVSAIPTFLNKTEKKNTKFILGNRDNRIGCMPLHRIMSNTITSFLISIIIKQRIRDSQCGFRLIHRNVLEKLELTESGFQLESEMILQAAKNGIKIDHINIPTIYNGENSSINNWKDTLRFLRLIIRGLFN